MNSILAFETSSPVLSVALGTRQGKIKEFRSRSPLKHSENLIPLVDRLLKQEKISLKEIDAFAIDRGPGSFTGLRIGFSFLKGLLAARKKPCYGALSLDMISENVRPREGTRLGVVVDARRETIYSRIYLCRKGEWVSEGKLQLVSFTELKTRLREGMVFTGDALARYGSSLEEAFGKQIHFLSRNRWFPSAASLVKGFQARNSRLSPLERARDFLPLYFRASEAEEKRRALTNYVG